MLTMTNELSIRITRWEGGDRVRSITVEAPSGHIVDATQYQYGGGWTVQTNFSDFYEARGSEIEAMGTVLRLASYISTDKGALTPDREIEHDDADLGDRPRPMIG